MNYDGACKEGKVPEERSLTKTIYLGSRRSAWPLSLSLSLYGGKGEEKEGVGLLNRFSFCL